MSGDLMTRDEIADSLVAQHERWFKEHPTEPLIQTVWMQREDGEVMFVACPWKDAQEREFVLAGLRMVMEARKVVRYAMWTEVWLTMGKVPERYGQVGEDPDRTEAVFTLVVERSGVTARLQHILRGRSGGVRKLRLEPTDDALRMGGALADLLPERSVN
jgi:hypothetical protein